VIAECGFRIADLKQHDLHQSAFRLRNFLFPATSKLSLASGEKRGFREVNRTIKQLFGVSLFLALCSVTGLYVGSRQAAAQTSQPVNILAQQLGSDPGDGLVLAGGFLMILALAVAFAGAMLWMRERQS
jgi:hypothetical protein